MILETHLDCEDQMICCILMLSSLVSSVWGTCVVKVAQSSYQVEENGDVTLEWTFTTTAHSSSDSLFILCSQLTDHKASVLFCLHEGVEVPESQDEKFSGRVQWDTDVLREGRLRLHVSRLRTEDSGVYLCEVSTGYDGSYDSCDLNVTAAGDESKPQRPTVSPQPESQGCFYIGLISAAVPILCACVVLAIRLVFKNRLKTNRSPHTVSFSEKQQTRTLLEGTLSLRRSDAVNKADVTCHV